MKLAVRRYEAQYVLCTICFIYKKGITFLKKKSAKYEDVNFPVRSESGVLPAGYEALYIGGIRIAFDVHQDWRGQKMGCTLTLITRIG